MGGTADDVMSLPTNSFVSINIYIYMYAKNVSDKQRRAEVAFFF